MKQRASITTRLVATTAMFACAVGLVGTAGAQTRPAPAHGSSESPGRSDESTKEDGEPASKDLPEVLVTASRMEVPLKDNPAATTIVGDQVLQTMPRGVGAEEALRLVPGVKVDNQANGERVHISIRGQGLLTERGIRGIKILLDGLPLNDPSGFAPDLFDVDWSNVERIEVLRGPASALYGGGSGGGVINIITKSGSPQTWGGDGMVSAGSNQFWKAQAAAGGSQGPYNYRLSASRSFSEGWRVHTGFDATNVYGKFRMDVGKSTHVTLVLAGTEYYNQNAEGLNVAWLREDRSQANPDAIRFNEFQRTRRGTLGIVGQLGIASNQDLGFRLYYRNTDWKEAVPSTVQGRSYNTAGTMLQYNLHMGTGFFKNHVSVGADLGRQLITDRKHPNLGDAIEGPDLVADQSIQQTGIGVLLLDRVELGPDWGVMVGLRHDHISNALHDYLKAGGVDLSGRATFSMTTGRAGVSWNVAREIGLYANWSQGFMPPATEELANNPDRLGGFNRNIVPATSMSEEIGARGTLARRLYYELAAFYLTTDRDFGRYRRTDRPLETFYGNVGSSRRIGLEAYLDIDPLPSLEVQVAYTAAHFTYPEINSLFGQYRDKIMPNSPTHQLASNIQYVLDDRWVFGVIAEAVSRTWVDQPNTMSAAGYCIVSPRLGFRWKDQDYRAEIVAHVRNALGTKYIAFTEPDPDGNSFQPGPTTEAFVTARLQFRQ